jgi:ABC-2 type transport system permease protein
MKKYRAVFLMSLKSTLNYRGELAMWGIIDAMPLVGNLILWTMVFGSRDTVGGFTIHAMLLYYILGYCFQQMTGSHFEDHYVKEIVNGNISGRLFKPVSLKKSLVFEELAWRVTGTIITLAPIAVLVWAMGIDMTGAMSPLQALALLFVLASGFFIDAIFSLAIIATGFIFEEARSLMHLKWMLSWLFSGSMIPFELMPEWLEKASKMLPFQTRYYLPTNLYLGKMTNGQIIESIIVVIFWMVILYLWIKWLWVRNLKKFTAVGS